MVLAVLVQSICLVGALTAALALTVFGIKDRHLFRGLFSLPFWVVAAILVFNIPREYHLNDGVDYGWDARPQELVGGWTRRGHAFDLFPDGGLQDSTGATGAWSAGSGQTLCRLNIDGKGFVTFKKYGQPRLLPVSDCGGDPDAWNPEAAYAPSDAGR